jgi:hypothetical protein
MRTSIQSSWEWYITPLQETIYILASTVKESIEKVEILCKEQYNLKNNDYSSEWYTSLNYGVVAYIHHIDKFYSDWGIYE